MSPDQIIAQFQQILTTLQRIVNASGDLAERVDTLEQGSAEILGKLTALQGSLEILLEKLHAAEEMESVVQQLQARVAALESGPTVH
jgi:DNA repair exonuclease SbcCD ATPase subunit